MIFSECTGPEEKIQRARQMLKELKEDKMKKTLDPSKILNYSVNWSDTGNAKMICQSNTNLNGQYMSEFHFFKDLIDLYFNKICIGFFLDMLLKCYFKLLFSSGKCKHGYWNGQEINSKPIDRLYF
jgi:hypothetical protein